MGALSGIAGCGSQSDDGGIEDLNLTHLFLELEATSGSTEVNGRLCARFDEKVPNADHETLSEFIELPGQGSLGGELSQREYNDIDLGLSSDPKFDMSEASVQSDEPNGLPGPITDLECNPDTSTTSDTSSQNRGPFPDGRSFDIPAEDSHLLGVAIEGIGKLQSARSQLTSSPIRVDAKLGEPDFVYVYTPDGFIYERSQWLFAAQSLVDSEAELGSVPSFDYPGNVSSQPRRGIIPGITHSLSGLLAAAQQFAQTKFHASFPLYLLAQDAVIGPERYEQQVEGATKEVVSRTIKEVGSLAVPGVKASGSGTLALTAKGTAQLTNLANVVRKSREEQNGSESTGELYARLIDTWAGLNDVLASESVPLIDYMVEREGRPPDDDDRNFHQYIDAVLREYDTLASIASGYDVDQNITNWEDISSSQQQEYLGNFKANIYEASVTGQELVGTSDQYRCFLSAFYPAAANTERYLSTVQQLTDLAVDNIESEEITPGGINHPARLLAEGRVEQSAPPSQEYAEYDGSNYRLMRLPAGDSSAGSRIVFHSAVSDGVIVELDEDGLPDSGADAAAPIQSTPIPETITITDQYAKDDSPLTIYSVENGLPTRELWQKEAGRYSSISATLNDDVVYFLENSGRTTETFQALQASDGSEIWNTELTFQERNISPADASPWTITSPAIHENKAILDIGGRWASGGTFVIDLVKQEVVSRSPELDARSIHALDTGVYALYEEGIARISMAGEQDWYEPASISVSTPPVETQETVYVATTDGYLLALSPGGGKPDSTKLLGESQVTNPPRISGQLITPADRPETAVVVPLGLEDGSGRVVSVGYDGAVRYSLTTENPVVGVEFVGDLVYIMMSDGTDLYLSVRFVGEV